MRTILILLTISALGLSFSPDREYVRFHNDLDKAQRLAKKKNQLLLIDFTAKWCGACKMMDRETFSDRRLVRFLNNNAVAVKVDIESLDGLLLKQEHGITLLPTLLFMYPDGEVAHRVERTMTADEIQRTIENYEDELIYRDPNLSHANRARKVEELRQNQEKLKKVGFIGQTYKIVLTQTSTYEHAVTLYQKYETALGERPTIFESPKSGLYSITIGEYDSRDEAEKAIKRNRNLDKSAIVKAVSDL